MDPLSPGQDRQVPGQAAGDDAGLTADAGGSDLDAMAALIGGSSLEDNGAPTDDAGQDDGGLDLGLEDTPATPAGRADQRPYEQMSDEELTQAVQGMSPAQLRSAILRQRDYTQKTQEIANRRRELDTREQGLYERATAAQQAPPAAAAAAPPQAAKLTIQDCVDEYGVLDMERFAQFEAQRDSDINTRIEDALKPVGEKLSQREQREMAASQQRVTDAFEGKMAKMRQTFPGWTPEVEQTIYTEATTLAEAVGAQAVLSGKIELDPVKLYAQKYPREWGLLVARYEQAKAAKKPNTQQAPPAASGRVTGGKTAPPLEGDARLDAMAAMLQSGGLNKVGNRG